MADADTTPGGSACPTDAELRSFSEGRLDTGRTDAIAAHLDRCLSCQQQLEQFDSSSADAHRGEAEPAVLAYAEESACERAVEAAVQRGGRSGRPATGSPPERLGEFELLEPLGAGGMGTVFKARHERLGTISAIKLLHVSQQADERMIERFQREMVALGKLDHPNIVRALDAGEDAGVHYLVMEYIDGADLGAIVQRTGPLAIADACEAARQTALGLAYVHEHGRVHRDVKPSNLMVSSKGQVKLLDLGLARVDEYALDEPTGTTDDLLGADPGLTHTHQVMGTLEYMPPEQAASSKTVTEKADLYALGCTLYKLLAGHAPFGSGQSVTAMSQLMAHVQRPAPPIRESRSDVPPGLAQLLERMLAKRPEDRPASAAEIAAALTPYARGSDLAALAVPAAATAGGASTARTLPDTKRMSAHPVVAVPRAGLSRVQKWTLTAGLLLLCLLLLAIPVGLISLLYLETRAGVVIVEADSADAKQLLQANNGGLYFVPEQGGPGTRIPVRPGMQDLRPGKYFVEQIPRQEPRAVFVPAEFDLVHDEQVVVSLGVAQASGRAAPDTPPGEQDPTSTAGPPVDLIALVDPERDIRGDDWKLVDGALVSRSDRPSAMHIPYRPPDYYRVDATVQRIVDDESLLLGLVAGGKIAYVAVDSHPYLGARTGMHTVDGVGIGSRSGDLYTGQVLPPGQEVQLTAWVKYLDGQVNIRLDADGRELFSWRGAVDRLGTWSGYRPNEPSALYLANWTAELRVSNLQLVPLEGEGQVITFTDPATDRQRAALERAIWKGAKPRVRTNNGSLTNLTRLDEIRDGMQLVQVSLAGNEWLNDNDLLYFASLETLDSLDFSKTAITQNGLEMLGPLPNLQRLTLSQLMAEDIVPRTAELYPSLTTLNASGNRLDGDNLAALEGLPALRELDLSRTAVTSAGLGTLPELPNLRTLSLAGTRVDALSAIGREKLPALTRLNVLGTAVTIDAAERSLPAAAPPDVVFSDGPVNLMDLIDVERDSNAWESTWTREDDVLRTHPKSRLMLPVHLPREFDLEMTARALEPNNSTIVGIALPDGTHFAVGFDHSPDNGPTAIVHWIDGIYQENSPVKADVSTFPYDDSEPVTVRIAVRGKQQEIDIRAFKNGAEILGWQGDRSRLKVTNDWWLGVDPTRPWISQFDGLLEIQKFSVTPVDGEVALPYPPEPSTPPTVVESAKDATVAVADPVARELQQRMPGLEVISGYGTVDLLPLIDVERDYDGWGYGRWERRNDVFQIQRSRLALPVALPMEFDITMTATRRAAGTSPVFVLPLSDGTRFAVGFDHSPEQGSFTILHGVDGTEELASPVKTQMVTYPQDSVGPPATVRVSVRGKGDTVAIRAFKDGQEVLSWEGDRKRLKLAESWWSGADWQRPRISLYDGLFTIQELSVTPHEGRIGLPDFGPSWGTPDRDVADWVLAHGGEIHFKFDESDPVHQNVRPGEAMPERPFWLTRIGSLSGVDIPADWFQQVARLERLEELWINQASFKNGDLAPLAQLASLTVFGAYSSTLDDAGAASVVGLPRLERFVIGDTVVTAEGVHGLEGHPTLKEYSQSGARTADQIAAILQRVPNIEHVVFTGSDLSGAGLEQLWGLDGMRRLYINNCSGLVDTDARQLLGLPNLTILDIRGSSLTGAALEPVGRLASLEKLRMWNQRIGDAGIKHLANLRNLNELDAWKTGLTDQAIPTIAGFGKLRILKLGENSGITDASVPLLARMDALRQLHVTGTSISEDGVQELREALPNCRVHGSETAEVDELDLRGQVVTDDSLREMLDGAAPKKLLLQGPDITDASIAYLASLPGLGELQLHGTSVTNDGLSPLSEAASLYRLELWEMPQIDEHALPHIARIPGLKAVAFKSTEVYGPGLELLHGTGMSAVYIGHPLLDAKMLEKYIVPFGTLNGLDLAGSRFADEDVELIASKMTVTYYLHLGYNPNITGPGLRFIRDMPELRTLNLDASAVDDDGLTHLKGAEHLQKLSLRHTAVTDASTDTLATLTGLQSINVSSTAFTPAGVERLRELMPGVAITADEVSR